MRYLVLFLSFFIVASCFGQITINPENIYSAGDWARIANVPELPPGFDPGTTGPDQAWDFSDLDMDTTYSVLFLDPAQTPFANDFPESNIVVNRVSYLDEILIYGTKSDTSYLNMGMAGQFEEYNDVVGHFIPYQTGLNFPVNYLDSIIEEVLFEFKIDSEEPGIDSVWVRIWFDFHVIVDAWGILATPISTYDVLRSKATIGRIDSTWILSAGVWELVDTYEGTRVEYDFMTDTEGYPVVEFASNVSGSYYGFFTYLEHYGPMPYIPENENQTDLQVYPVPADNNLYIKWDKKKNGVFILLDLQGREILKQDFTNTSKLELNTSAISEGYYLYKLSFAEKKELLSGKVVIQ